jgi:WD40 repeat protein
MKPKTVRASLAAGWLALAPLAALAGDGPTLKTTLGARDKRSSTVFVAFSPDGKTLASRGIDLHTRIWDLSTGKNTSIGDTCPPEPLFFSPDGKTLILLHEDVFQICDVASGKHTTMKKVLGAVPFSPDGKSLVVEEKGGLTLRTLGTAFDGATGQNDVALKGANARFGNYETTLAFSPDGATLAVRDTDGDVMLWDVASGKNTATLPQTAGPQFLFSPDGKTLAAASGSKEWITKRPAAEDRAPKIWDVTTGKKIAALEVEPGDSISSSSLVFSPDGKTLARGTTDGPGNPLAGPGKSMKIKIWDATNGKKTATIEESGAGLAAAGRHALVVFSPDGKTLAAPCNDGTVKLYDVGAANLAASLKAGNYIPTSFFAVFSPDGALLATTNEESGISLWNMPGAKPAGK